MLSNLLLFSTILFQHIALCTSFFLKTATFTTSFHHNVSPLILLPLFFPHASSHTFIILSLKCPNKFGSQTSTNLTTFSSNRFLIFKSFSKFIFLLSVHVFLTTFQIFFLMQIWGTQCHISSALIN